MLAILPLLVAFVNANIYFEKLTKQSLFNMSQAVETTRTSRILIEELAVMERSARQYFVLHDPLLLANYVNSHGRFSNAVNTMQSLPISKPLKLQLSTFSAQEITLFTLINDNENASFDKSMVDAFTQLTNQAYKITEQNNRIIDEESALFKTKVTQTQRLLFWQTLTLIPLAVLIAGLITWMIASPIRRMDAAIHQLGKGDYEHAIEINGPGDLRLLGERLNWLRIALKNLHQQKQLFLQQASHELKTPLTAIREASELLNDGVAGKLNQTQSSVVNILRENSLRLQKMIENLLKYAEIQFNSSENEFNLLEPKITQQSLKTLVSEVINTYALTISHKKINVQTSIEDLVLTIDIQKLQTILDNLISNAIKFTPANGRIIILARHRKSLVTIEIKDTGPGIKENHVIGAFEPFYRGEQPKSSLVAGSGLGLFIAKEAAMALKGEIKIIPSQLGAHFIVQIPFTPSVN